MAVKGGAIMSAEIVGAKEALRELNKIDKKARRQVTKDYAQIVSVVIQEARNMTPQEPPLRGMKYTWKTRSKKVSIFPWNGSTSDRAMKPFVSGKKPRQYGAFVSDLAVFGIRWKGADAVAVEMAGRGSVPTERGRQMVRSLNQKYGTPGRFLWRAYERHAERVTDEVRRLILQVMRDVQRSI